MPLFKATYLIANSIDVLPHLTLLGDCFVDIIPYFARSADVVDESHAYHALPAFEKPFQCFRIELTNNDLLIELVLLLAVLFLLWHPQNRKPAAQASPLGQRFTAHLRRARSRRWCSYALHMA